MTGAVAVGIENAQYHPEVRYAHQGVVYPGPPQSGGGVELRDYWRVIRQRWRVVVASTLLGLLGATGLTIMTPPTYQSTVELFVAPEVGGTSSELMQGSSFLLDRVKSYVAIADK